MGYCTKQDIIDQWSLEDLLIVADRDGDGSLSAAEDGYITKAIARADAKIDNYIGVKYTLPLAAPYPPELTSMSADMAMYYLSSDAGRMSALKEQRFDRAMLDLKDLSRGDAQLAVAAIKSEGLGSAILVGVGENRVFTRDTMRDL
jgi:phage gp36-like protein